MTWRIWASAIPDNDSEGFTLLEVVISMIILGLMAVAVFGGLRLGTQASEKGENEARRLQHLRIVTDMISAQLRSAFPYSLKKRLKPGQTQEVDSQEEEEELKKDPPVFFEGTQDAVRFVAVSALDPSMNGLVRVLYELGENGNELDFKAREDFVRGIDSLSEAHDPDKEDIILLKALASMQFNYFGKAQEEKEPGWKKEWSGRTMRGLPRGIRISIVFDNDKTYPLDWIVWIPSEPSGITTGGGTSLPFMRSIFK